MTTSVIYFNHPSTASVPRSKVAERFYSQGRQPMTSHTRQGGKTRQIISAVLQTLNALSEGTVLLDFSLGMHLIAWSSSPQPHNSDIKSAWDKFQRSQLRHGHVPTTSLPRPPPKSNILRNVWHVTSPETITNIGSAFKRCHASSTDGRSLLRCTRSRIGNGRSSSPYVTP